MDRNLRSQNYWKNNWICCLISCETQYSFLLLFLLLPLLHFLSLPSFIDWQQNQLYTVTVYDAKLFTHGDWHPFSWFPFYQFCEVSGLFQVFTIWNSNALMQEKRHVAVLKISLLWRILQSRLATVTKLWWKSCFQCMHFFC